MGNRKSIFIYGAGGFGREVQWLIERINQKQNLWKIEGYIDDGVEVGTEINGYKVLGGMEILKNYDKSLSVVCAIGNAHVRRKIIEKIKSIKEFAFPNLIDPTVEISNTVSLGEGNIICAGNILTVNIAIKDFVIINLNCTVGHDVVLDSYITVYPAVNIYGIVKIGTNVEIGTGTKIIQDKQIGENTILGAGSVVIHDIPENCTAVGAPAKPVKFSRGGYKKLLIIGASGHGKVIADMVTSNCIYETVHFLDDNVKVQKQLNNGILGDSSYAIEHKEEFDVIVGIGNSIIRKRIQEVMIKNGVSVATLIHPDAQISSDVEIGCGSVVMAGSVIQRGTQIGKGVIVNTLSSIDHECCIGDYCHVAVGSNLAGNVNVQENTWIGAGAVVSNNLSIVAGSVIGAGAVVVKNITEKSTYTGIPAKKTKLEVE